MNKFKKGQVYKYKTRIGEEDSRLTIFEVFEVPNSDLGNIVYISIDNLSFQFPDGARSFGCPIWQSVLDKEDLELTKEPSSIKDKEFKKGVSQWLEQKKAALTIPIIKLIGFTENLALKLGGSSLVGNDKRWE